MKKFFKLLGIIIVLIIVFVLVAGLFISKDYHFEKSITINAPKEEIWNNVSHFSSFDKWDPWKAYDPGMTRTIEGTDGAVGAVYKWKGNSDVGSGSQTIKALRPYDEVEIDLHFKEPFENKARVRYILAQQDNGVKVTWSFDTHFSYPLNALTYFMNMDKNLDKDFSTGLANLKKLSESNTTMTATRYLKAETSRN